MRGARAPASSKSTKLDACAKGQISKYLCVVDKYQPECLPIDAAGSIRLKLVLMCLAD